MCLVFVFKKAVIAAPVERAIITFGTGATTVVKHQHYDNSIKSPNIFMCQKHLLVA